MEKDVNKRKRPDRAAKRQAQKELSQTVVKCSLKGLLCGEHRRVIQQAIEKRVKQCSHRTHNASLALNLLVKEHFHEVQDLEDVALPDFWDQTFLRQLMLGTQGAVSPDQHITDLHNRFPSLLSKDERHDGDRNIYSAAAIKMSTNIKNHLVINFPKILMKYLSKVIPLEKNDANYAFRKVHGSTTWFQGTPRADQVVAMLRQMLGLLEGQTIGEMWFKQAKNLKAILRFFVHVNRAIEVKHDENIKMFNLLPIFRIKAHFITIDTSSLFGILKEVGIVKTQKILFGEEQWASILKTSLIKGKGKVFTGTIDTDGYVVNVHFEKKKKTYEGTSRIPTLDGKRVVGVDPGRTNIFQMVEKTDNGKFKTYKLTRTQYYLESGMTKAQKQSDKWNKGIQDEMLALSEASPKGSSLEHYLVFLTTMFSVRDKLWDEAFKMRWRAQRFRLYGGKKRTFAKFLNKLGDPKDVVLAFGAGKFAPTGKGELSVPTTRAFKECCYRFPHIPVDEFRTTKIHYRDDSLLQKVMKRNGRKDGRLVAVRGLLWCCSTIKGESKFVNRDVNAAINILRCAVLPKRPDILVRRNATSRLEQSCKLLKEGRILKC